MKIIDIINNIDNESLALPVFQRGYVWKRPQVKDLMSSLYRGYPVGSLLTWTTRAELVDVRGGNQDRQSMAINLLLDGQQRLTSLYGIIRGKSPVFFDGDARAFEGLYFNLDNEEFEFFAPAKMSNNPLWVKVTDIFSPSGFPGLISELTSSPDYSSNLGVYVKRATDVQNIQNTDLHILEITGDDKTTNIVVDIFNRINQGGTKLSKGDLTLSRIGASWPDARKEMQERLSKWKMAGFDANLDWLLRCMNAIITKSSEFERLEPVDVGVAGIQQALQQTENAVDRLLEAMRSHLFMDHDRLFNSKQSFPVMVKYLVDCGGRFPNQTAMAQLLHWYVSVAIWGRFSGPTETIINQDLAVLSEQNPIGLLLRNLRASHGERRVMQENFDLPYSKARLYPLLYIMSRVQDARDWGTGNQLRHHSLGSHTNLEMHHIFPKAYLRRNGMSSRDANNMGNIAFQTRETNREIGAKPPVDYMPGVVANWPGALESQWIPMDKELWKVENYHQFLEARRRLLAESANNLLDTLRAGDIPPAATPSDPSQQVTSLPAIDYDSIDPDDEEAILMEINRFVLEQGLPPGEIAYEVFSGEAQEPVAVLDIAWPDGLQVEYSRPVALLIDEEAAVNQAASNAGFHVVTTAQEFRSYVESEILA